MKDNIINDHDNDYIRCATYSNGDGTATVTVTAMDGYYLDIDGEVDTEITFKVYMPAQPVLGRSYMLDGKHVLVGKIDRDEQGRAIAVYDEHTSEKHLWPANQASRI